MRNDFAQITEYFCGQDENCRYEFQVFQILSFQTNVIILMTVNSKKEIAYLYLFQQKFQR